MKKPFNFVGIDISKAHLDICVKHASFYEHITIENTIEAVGALFDDRRFEGFKIIGMEHTGRYNTALLTVLAGLSHRVYVIAPLHLSRSLGLVRGKTDKIDAERICKFTEKHCEDLQAWYPQRAIITELGVLLAHRKRLQKVRGQLVRAQQDVSILEGSCSIDLIQQTNESLIGELEGKIKALDKAIADRIGQDEQLKAYSDLLQSITGVGKILCWNLLFRTNEFKTIREARKLACYAGVVPFEHSSGSSVRGKRRVSPYADREFKSILHMAAMRATRIEGELRDYYLRKVGEGKNKMSVLNAIRNKIIHRAYAVVKHKKPYQPYLVLS